MRLTLFFLTGSFLIGIFLSSGCGPTTPVENAAAQPTEETVEALSVAEKAPETVPLFDGETLDGWEIANFGGEGEIVAKEGVLTINAGYPISGITSTRTDLPKTNYEILLEARKTQGTDFFCGLTFPVADSHCSLIVGGWGGPVLGLSCIDDADASRNETRKLMKFNTDQWYAIKVRVEPKRIQAWIDDELLVDQNIEGRKISVRNEVLPSIPLGISNFETTSEIRNVELRKLTDTQQ